MVPLSVFLRSGSAGSGPRPGQVRGQGVEGTPVDAVEGPVIPALSGVGSHLEQEGV